MCDVVGALIVSSTSVAGEGNQLECPVEDAGSCSRLFVLGELVVLVSWHHPFADLYQ